MITMKLLITILISQIHVVLSIINGSNAGVGEFPFMSAVYYKGNFTCGATILSEEWILTAAHCIYGRDETQFAVLTGTNDLLDPNGTETLVSQVIVHEGYQYSVNQAYNDVALLKLSVTLEFDNLTQPVTLSEPRTDPSENSSLVVMGWGVNKYKGNPVRFLQKAISSYDQCRGHGFSEPYSIDILQQIPCGCGINYGPGDSGGPAVMVGSPRVQVGILSVKDLPCNISPENFPVYVTRINSYTEWIRNKTGV